MQHVSPNDQSLCVCSFRRIHSFGLSLLVSLSALGHSTKSFSADAPKTAAPVAAEATSEPQAEAETFTPPPETAKPVDFCELLSRGPGVALQDTEVTLHTFLEKFIADLQQKKFAHLNQFFHPRAKVRSDIGEKIESIINSRYDAPLQYSIFRVWRIKSPSASKQILDSCPESDGAKIITSFGYNEQFAVWIQIMGQNELGRLIVSIAPDKGWISIVGFRIQQWTQSGDDWRTWAMKGQAAEAKKNVRESYIAYDISQKLLEGKDLVLYPAQVDIIKKRDSFFTQPQLVETINKDLGITTTAYVGTLLAKEGSGLFLREYIAKELPTSKLNAMCLERGQKLEKAGWLNPTQGLRCNFLFKGMDPTKDSGLGGFYKTAEDLHPTVKK